MHIFLCVSVFFCAQLTLGLFIVDGACCSFSLCAFVKVNSDPFTVCLKHGANRLTVDTFYSSIFIIYVIVLAIIIHWRR